MESTDTTSGVNVNTQIDKLDSADCDETQTQKRVVKLSAKALANELDRLQSSRNAKLNKAANIRRSIEGLILNHDKTQVKRALEQLIEMKDDVKNVHNALLVLLPCDEKEKHDIWFKAKLLSVNECIANAKLWVSQYDENVKGGYSVDEINPEDSISNISKHSSHRSQKSGRSSTTSSAVRKAAAEKAALEARAAALTAKHALEEQELQIRKKRELLDLEAEIAASTAKLNVLQASDHESYFQGPTDGMNSYVEKEKQKESIKTLNPLAKEHQFELQKHTCQLDSTKWSSISTKGLSKDVRPKEMNRQTTPASQPPYSYNEPHQEIGFGTSHHFQHQETAQSSNHQQINLNQPGEILTIMHRQNAITEALVQQQHLMTLPSRDIPTFDGDPLQYKTFIMAFEQGVEEKAAKADCLYYLEQFTRGQPCELVRSCQHMAPERGYKIAKDLLQKHFGNQYKIASAYMEKALNWQVIKSEDVKALQAYALFLRGCCNVMQELQYMQELDMPINMRTIMSKLPFKMREQWRTIAHDIMETTNQPASFVDLVVFIERLVSILSDPLFGEIREPSGVTGIKAFSGFKSQHKGRIKGSVMATTVTPMEMHERASETASEPEKERNPKCLCCERCHTLEECKQFNRKKHKEKIQLLRSKGICFGCLCVGHMSRECIKRLTCKMCGQTHPTVLHIKQQSSPEPQGTSNQPTSPKTCGHTGAGQDRCVLSILPVKIRSVKGNHTVKTYAFLDPGSSATFCSEHLMQQLRVTGRKTNFLLSTMGQKTVVTAYSLTGLQVSGLNSDKFHVLPEVLTQREMPVTVDSMVTPEELAKWPYLSKVEFPHLSADVGLLIGTNAPKVLEPWEVINSCGNGPYAIKTVLGWVVNGPLTGNSGASKGKLPMALVNKISVCKLEEMLVKQYNQDFNERNLKENGMSREDLKFMEIMEHSAILHEGRYCLKLPFKTKEVFLPNNIAVAKQRIQGLKKRFLNNKRLHQEYTEYMKMLISRSYAEQVPEHQLCATRGKVWYIPHHGVHHPRKGSLRVVFDCGATFQGVSLNDELLPGPNLTSSLLGVLLRFRNEPVAFVGDIQAMFHQVKVAEKDRDFLRFLWWPDGNITQDLKEYRMTVHLFGAVSSPSCASYALRKTADDNKSESSEEVVQSIKQNFYVDDYLKSSATEREAIKMIKDLTALCQKGGFTLEKWISNSRVVLQSLTANQRATYLKELNLDRDKLPVERVLGLQWCVETDSFRFKMEVKQQSFTRRGMLSVTSSVYDPLGFLAPITLLAKMMQQELCRRGCGWDDELPKDILPQWKSWLEDLDQLTAFRVKRCFKPMEFGTIKHAQLHHFADASEKGYGTVTYIRMLNHKNDVQVAFLLGKARVTPLKAVTIPRLELTAAVLAARVDSVLKSELDFLVEESVFWTDSTSVIKYLNNEDKRFRTFVANRISTIRETTEPSQWKHISSKDNPADDASRGMKVSNFLKSSRWLEGPVFLWRQEEDWPKTVLDDSMDPDDQEVRQEVIVNLITTSDISSPTDQLITYFSDWRRLKTVVAWVLRLKAVLMDRFQLKKQLKATVDKGSQEKTRGTDGKGVASSTSKCRTLTLDELSAAEDTIIRYCQEQKFGPEITSLSSGKDTVSRQSSIYRLDPVLEDGLLRVGGRLSRGAMPEEAKHPLILSKDQHISKLILKHTHQNLGHSGRAHTLSKVRRKFWITNANTAIRTIISDCSFCRRYNGRAVEQKMADLPRMRLLPDLPPFTNAGVDYFGPVEVRRGRSTCKRYGVIFTCMASRAVHLEVAVSLDTDACINALRRFISRRGQVEHLTSDNGTNFIGANRELKEALKGLNQDRIQRSMAQVGIHWNFNPPAASHHGGVWESMIRLVRRVLTSVLHQQRLDDDGLHTVFCEVEAILNDRPITKLSDDINDLEPLTPNHILLLKGKPALSPGLFEKHDLYIKRRWRQVQYIADLFWKRWTQEYLPLLQERQKWNERKRSLTPGDIVVIMDSSTPRGSWPLGKVLEVFPDKRGLVRSVKLQTKSNIIERPVTKLCLVHGV